ncbi:UDP-N-acetylmuramoyl-tripeptide--D-alanyl-D-alanine ligase [bacterium]|nr:UDP-N-acetylmuramoyl-tripeptide--D-alanyl-D-alanine ligase [bacterium]
MKTLIQWKLAWHAKRILAKYEPTVVAVTGSVGKTSTRNAIAAVLSAKFRVRSPAENYNNEFGVPLTIIGAKTPGRSLFGWARVLAKAAGLWLGKDATYPNMLVLEYGLDRPGDISALCRIAPPNVGVLTAVTPVHAEFFPSIEDLAKEKGQILRGVKAGGTAILNADDPLVAAQRGSEKTVTYGFGDAAEVRGGNYRVETEPVAVTFDLTMDGQRAPVTLNGLLGRGQAYAALAAAAVGRSFGMSIDEIVEGLSRFEPQAGRMRPLPGIKGTRLLDDSYNAAPASMASALETLRAFVPPESARRIAALGKMAELGKYSADEHRLLGIRAAEVADVLVCVGEEARDIRHGAIEAGMDPANIELFANAVEAGRWLDFNCKAGDVILIKGSQSARMEKVVKDLMAEPLRAGELLVRQYGAWLED